MQIVTWEGNICNYRSFEVWWELCKGGGSPICSRHMGSSSLTCLFLLLLQKIPSEQHCTLSPACASGWCSPWLPWWWGSLATRTAGSVPGRSSCRTETAVARAATARMAAQTRRLTSRSGDTAASKGLWTRMCSPLPRSWSAPSGWRSGSASLGRSGWMASPRFQGPGAWTATTSGRSRSPHAAGSRRQGPGSAGRVGTELNAVLRESWGQG